ncbi:MAG TPA: Rv3235 family protein, partial [Streptosporangiaceae bacterium]
NSLTGQLVHRPSRPLPDPVAIYQIAIPQADPPYDLADDTATLDQLDLALPTRAEAKTTAWPAAQAPDTAHFAERYSAGPWPSQFAQALAETLAGTRPRSQLAPWTSIKARRRISQLSPVLATASRPKLKRVITTSPADGILEMTVVVDLGPRVRALAIRLERTDTQTKPASSPAKATRSITPAEPHWRCTAIEAA